MNYANAFVAAVDVGTFKNWGIAANQAFPMQTASTLTERVSGLVAKIAEELRQASRPVALGFEAPLWVPIRENPEELLKARPGEGTRPWSAGAGGAVTAAGLAVVPWWLTAIQKAVGAQPQATMDPTLWRPGVLLVWEAFVSAAGKTKTTENQNVQDAKSAVEAFCSREWKLQRGDDNIKVYSLAAAALRFCGWQILGEEDIPTLIVGPSISI